MSDADNENVAVKFERPTLERTRVLEAASGEEKEIPLT